MKKLFDILVDSFNDGVVEPETPIIDFFDPIPKGSIEFVGEVKDRYARNIFCQMANISCQSTGMFDYSVLDNQTVMTVKSETDIEKLKASILTTSILGHLFDEYIYAMSKNLALRVHMSGSQFHLTNKWRVVLSLEQNNVQGIDLSQISFPSISPSDRLFYYIVESFVTPASKFRLSAGVTFVLPPVEKGEIVLRKLTDDRLINLFAILATLHDLFNCEVDKLAEVELTFGQNSFSYTKATSFLDRLKEQCDLVETIFWHSVKNTVANANEFYLLAVKENMMLVGLE